MREDIPRDFRRSGRPRKSSSRWGAERCRATGRRGLRRPDLCDCSAYIPGGLALELDVALLRDRSLLNRDQLTFHLAELGRRLLVSANQERRRPENDHSGRCRYPRPWCADCLGHPTRRRRGLTHPVPRLTPISSAIARSDFWGLAFCGPQMPGGATFQAHNRLVARTSGGSVTKPPNYQCRDQKQGDNFFRI